MTFFPEINIKKTKRNAVRKLREYPRWRRIASDIDSQKITQTYSFEQRQPHSDPSRPVEKLAITKIDAELELDAIEQAVSNIFKPSNRKILYDKYLATYPKTDIEIYQDLGYERSQYYESVEESLLAFAELYRSGSLVVENRTISGQLADN